MIVKTADINLFNQTTDCAVIPIFGDTLPSTSRSVDQASGGQLKALVKTGDFKGDAGNTLTLHQLQGCKAARLILLGMGKANEAGEVSASNYLKAVAAAAQAIQKTASKTAHYFFADVCVSDRNSRWCAEQMAIACYQVAYRFDELKSDKPKAKPLKTVSYVADKNQRDAAKLGIEQGSAIGEGMDFCKTLGNLPGNICTPSYLAKQAKKLATGDTKFTTKVLTEAQMAALGMGSLLSVSAGSKEPAKLIAMEYKGAAKTQPPIVLVGKGITFDTGGISLKPGAGMDEMKFDMCGAASVFGVMQALKVLQPALNVVGVVAAAENMPSGKATKPGDIVTAMSGKTIEILNTDAEGRLVLCDALTYVERYKPAAVVDIATLTGACVVALGSHASGLYSNKDEFAEELLSAGEQASDRAWHMPLWDEYKQQLDSNFADLANIGGREAGSVTAACFLSHFTEAYTWAHLDIAGTAWKSGAQKGATGRPVPLLMRFLLNRLQSK